MEGAELLMAVGCRSHDQIISFPTLLQSNSPLLFADCHIHTQHLPCVSYDQIDLPHDHRHAAYPQKVDLFKDSGY